ncbi:MAG: 50S ribosomal protein L25/general stress protein Ctc [Actinomycetota bacterium]
MAELKIKAELRQESGKGAARRARASGRVPAVVYGRGMEPLSISVDRREFVTALHSDAGMNILLSLQVDGESILALTKELQTDPVRGAVLHADFIKVDRTQEVEVDVPVHLIGEAPGVKEGGILEQPLSQVHVRCLATEVPEHVDADISVLTIGDSLRVSDLAEGREFHILNDPNAVVVSIAAPITEEQLEAMVAEVAGVEEVPPEEEAAAEAVPEEGEAAPAGEGAEAGVAEPPPEG